MRRLFLAACLAGSWAITVTAAAEGKFTSTLSDADKAAAGIATLSPDQLARLDALVEAYRQGAPRPTGSPPPPAPPPAATADAATAPAAPPPPPRQVSPAARTAHSGEPKPARSGGLIAQMKDWVKRSADEPPPIVESTIAGKFRGWQGREVFTLANGERWRVANNENYYSPAVQNPRVFIFPATTGGYWMQFPDLKIQVRVQPLLAP